MRVRGRGGFSEGSLTVTNRDDELTFKLPVNAGGVAAIGSHSGGTSAGGGEMF